MFDCHRHITGINVNCMEYRPGHQDLQLDTQIAKSYVRHYNYVNFITKSTGFSHPLMHAIHYK
jgi:hypothetical protein